MVLRNETLTVVGAVACGGFAQLIAGTWPFLRWRPVALRKLVLLTTTMSQTYYNHQATRLTQYSGSCMPYFGSLGGELLMLM